jgi:N6-L-threonylcarbamoyladenine synthase
MGVAPLILGIETSCDDTACAVLDGEGRVLASVVSSQLEAHGPYGGVVPEIASREHLRNWLPVATEALTRAGCGLDEIGAVAATSGPGLVGSLLVGFSIGKALAYALERPFLAVHHLEGHLYSPFLDPGGAAAAPIPERFVGLVVSGGHTALYEVAGERIATLAQTRDDALGEAFDKVGKRVGLPFPGGPHVDALAEAAAPEGTVSASTRGDFALARCDGSLDFSYSGLKTQAQVEIARLERRGVVTNLAALLPGASPAPEVLGLLASFRRAAVAQLLDRIERLHRRRPFETLAVAGGAAANRLLRRELAAWSVARGVDLRLVALELSGDNAAMIAHAALLRWHRGESDDPRHCDVFSRQPLDRAPSSRGALRATTP